MIAFHDIKAEARETAAYVTHPARAEARPPAVVIRGEQPPDDTEETSHIEPWMEVSFKALTHASETGEPFALISCFMNGAPAALIAATQRLGDRTHVLPLFMAVQPWMKFSPHLDEAVPEEDA